MHRDVLDSPVLRFTGIQFVFADAVHLVNPIELSDFLTRCAEPAEHMALEIFLIDLAAGIRTIEKLLTLRVRRRDAYRPRRANIADDAQRLEVGIEHLDA